MFDSTMNYIFRSAVLEYAAGGKAVALVRQLEAVREAYPPQAFHALMNLISSHDQARALHLLGWHDEVSDARAIQQAKQRLRLAVLIQMTYPGAPAIYYGDEVGVTGGDDPYNRATYPWADEGGQPDTALLADFTRLTALRHRHAVLRRGSLDAPLFADDHVLVQVRRLGSTWALTATNNAATVQRVTVTLPEGLQAEGLRDALGDAGALVVEGRRASFDVPPLFGRVWVTL
jgi:glycosidase